MLKKHSLLLLVSIFLSSITPIKSMQYPEELSTTYGSTLAWFKGLPENARREILGLIVRSAINLAGGNQTAAWVTAPANESVEIDNLNSMMATSSLAGQQQTYCDNEHCHCKGGMTSEQVRATLSNVSQSEMSLISELVRTRLATMPRIMGNNNPESLIEALTNLIASEFQDLLQVSAVRTITECNVLIELDDKGSIAIEVRPKIIGSTEPLRQIITSAIADLIKQLANRLLSENVIGSALFQAKLVLICEELSDAAILRIGEERSQPPTNILSREQLEAIVTGFIEDSEQRIKIIRFLTYFIKNRKFYAQ